MEGHAAQVLLEGVSGCDMMVVGSHGHGGFVGPMLGSVSHHVMSHSRCPVVVVPAVVAEVDLRPRNVVVLAPGTIPKTPSGKLRRGCSVSLVG